MNGQSIGSENGLILLKIRPVTFLEIWDNQWRTLFKIVCNTVFVVSGSLSPRYGACSGCGRKNGLQIWWVAANILNKQSRRQSTRGDPPVWGLGEVLTTTHRKNLHILRIIHSGLGTELIKKYRNIILPVVLYSCETWSLTFREECRLRVFENRMLRRIFGPTKDEETGEWVILHPRGWPRWKNSWP
jgi:hypothetical protein